MHAAVEHATWYAQWGVRKYTEDDVGRLTALLGREPQSTDFERHKVTPFEDNLIERNLLTAGTAGITYACVNHIVTDAGRHDDRTIQVKVQQR